MPFSAPLTAGDRLGPYEIIGPLGAGGMGVIFKALDTRLDRLVALKILPPEKVGNEESKRRFIQEAKAASALNHPNIITIYDIGKIGDTWFIAAELIQGVTLREPFPRIIPGGNPCAFGFQAILRDAPDGFSFFACGGGCRSAGAILSHIGDHTGRRHHEDRLRQVAPDLVMHGGDFGGTHPREIIDEEGKTADTCQGVSVWDEPCTRPATRCCKECGRWFCDAHFADADWRSMLGPLDRLKRMLAAVWRMHSLLP